MRAQAAGGNALFVLRLVLSGRQTPRAGFSTAVIDREKDQTEAAWTGSSLFPGLKALASRSAAVEESQGAVDFLEDEGQEYQAIKSVLPARTTEASPIPWPTIFAHEEQHQPVASTSSRTRTKTRIRACDPIARLVEDGNLVAARKVHDELRSIHSRVEMRFIYLDAARQCLNDKDVEGFLFWFKLYPNRPATLNHPGLKSIWEPVTSSIIDSYPFDLEVLEQYALECAKKGVLPATIHSLIRHLAFVAPPNTSRRIIDDVISTYVSVTTSASSTSDRAQRSRALVDKQVGGWREAYRQAILELRWHASEGEGASSADRDWRESSASYSSRVAQLETLHDRIEAAIIAPPPAGDLAQTLLDIHAQTSGSASALDISWTTQSQVAFRDHFIRPPGQSVRQLVPSTEVRTYEYWRAVMIAESRQIPANHRAVIETFSEHFRWYGLPDHRLRPREGETDTTISSLMYPRRSIMTNLIPSLLATLHPEELVPFHHEYLALSRTMPPILRPDGPIHNLFVRAMAHRISVDAAIAAVKTIVAHGYNPGSQAMASILFDFGRSSTYDEMFRLLEAMERGDPFEVGMDNEAKAKVTSSMTMPPPTIETYDWLAHIIANKRNYPDMAQEVLRRKEAYFGPTAATAAHAQAEGSHAATACMTG